MADLVPGSQILMSKLRLKEGDRGFVADILFDDENFSLRYLVADFNYWQDEKDYLIDMLNIRSYQWLRNEIEVDLSEKSLSQLRRVNEDEAFERVKQRQLYENKEAGLSDSRKDLVEDHSPSPSVAMHDEEVGNPHLRSWRELKGFRAQLLGPEKFWVSELLLNLEGRQVDSFVMRSEGGEAYRLNTDWLSEISFREETFKLNQNLEFIKKHQDPQSWSHFLDSKSIVGTPKE